MAVLTRLDGLLALTGRIYLRVSQLLLAGLVLLVGAQVVLRYATDRSILGIEELTALMFTWLVFLMAAVLHRRKRHITVTAAIDLAAERTRRWADLAIGLATIVFCVAVLVQLQAIWPFLVHTSMIYRIPEPAFKLALGVGIGTILLQEVVNIAAAVRAIREKADEGRMDG